MLQFITNGESHDEIMHQVREVLAGGCRWVQLRMKGTSREAIISTAKEVKTLCKTAEAIFILDDEVEIVKELQLDGVHLGKNDMDPVKARNLLEAEPIIGCTANTFADIAALPPMAIDYVGLGPFRFTATKQNLSPLLGLDGYLQIMEQCRRASIEHPIVAIGGIEFDDLEALMATGIDGIAVSGALTRAHDIATETRRWIDKLYSIRPPEQ